MGNAEREKLKIGMSLRYALCWFVYEFHNKRATPKWVTKSWHNRYDVVCGWNSLRDMNSSLDFYPFLRKFDLDLWHWPKVKVINTWVIVCALYLGTKYEVCRWNSLQDMTSSLVFYHFRQNLTLTFGQGHWHIECALLGTLVPSMKSVGEIASKIWSVLWVFLPILGKIWPWPLTMTKGQSHRHLGH